MISKDFLGSKEDTIHENGKLGAQINMHTILPQRLATRPTKTQTGSSILCAEHSGASTLTGQLRKHEQSLQCGVGYSGASALTGQLREHKRPRGDSGDGEDDAEESF